MRRQKTLTSAAGWKVRLASFRARNWDEIFILPDLRRERQSQLVLRSKKFL